jgi:acetyl-CoA carboxylase carboxyl transferase subunit alpha
MKNYLNFETDIKNLESEIEKLKDPYNQEWSLRGRHSKNI